MEKVAARIKGCENRYLIAYLIKLHDHAQDLNSYLQTSKDGITNSVFIQQFRWLLHSYGSNVQFSAEFISEHFGVKFCHVKFVRNRLTFYDNPSWAPNIIYINAITRFRGTNGTRDRIEYMRLPNEFIYGELAVSKPSKSLLSFRIFADLFQLLCLPMLPFEVRSDNLGQIRDVIYRDLCIYVQEGENIVPHFSIPRKYKKFPAINILVGDTINFENFQLICNEEFITTVYKCNVTKKCSYQAKTIQLYRKHIRVCEKISTQIIESQLRAYGDGQNVIEQLVIMGYLPEDARQYRISHFTCYDIESLETPLNHKKGEKTMINAVHKLLSIALGSTSTTPKCYVRKDDTHEAAVEMIELFLDELEYISECYDKTVPSYFGDAIDCLDEDSTDDSLSKTERTKLSSLKFQLTQYIRMDVYGYNSGKECSN